MRNKIFCLAWIELHYVQLLLTRTHKSNKFVIILQKMEKTAPSVAFSPSYSYIDYS